MTMPAQPTRNIVQIAAATAGNSEDQWVTLFALCDDGSLWQRRPIDGGQWRWSRVSPPAE
jgi:hypothetical protein